MIIIIAETSHLIAKPSVNPNHTVCFFSSTSVSFALCLAFGAKIKSVIEPEGVENLFLALKNEIELKIHYLLQICITVL